MPNLLTKLHKIERKKKSIGHEASLQFQNFVFHIPKFTGEVLSSADNVSWCACQRYFSKFINWPGSICCSGAWPKMIPSTPTQSTDLAQITGDVKSLERCRSCTVDLFFVNSCWPYRQVLLTTIFLVFPGSIRERGRESRSGSKEGVILSQAFRFLDHKSLFLLLLFWFLWEPYTLNS